MAVQDNIIQWNIRGFRQNYAELIGLIRDFSSRVVCLQETLLGLRTPRIPSGYKVYYQSHPQPVAGTGLAMIIHESFACIEVPIQTNIQAQAYRVGLSRPITYCNVYIQQHTIVSTNDLIRLYNQLPTPALIVGDFNAHNRLWENEENNIRIDANRYALNRGRAVEGFLTNSDIVLLNTGKPTHFHVQNATMSAPDVSLCSPALALDLAWTVLDDLRGSDHFPIVISNTLTEDISKIPRYCMRRANWTRYTAMTAMMPLPPNTSLCDMLELFYSTIIKVADLTIPKTSNSPTKIPVPWWTNECTTTARLRKQALRRYQRTKARVDLITYKRQAAIARRTKLLARRESWKLFISTVNRSTPMSKIWNRMRKMKGKYTSHSPPSLRIGNQIVSDPCTVAEHFAAHYSHISSTNNYDRRFIAAKQRAEQEELDFTTQISMS